ncbi:MAG: T9SS type A sorting domain-containing protein [Hymenobacter sp.]|nr:T9SS type A sorting domain-containing protein [Hymenobacter sp.]
MRLFRRLSRHSAGSRSLVVVGLLAGSLQTQAQNSGPTKIWDSIQGGNQDDALTVILPTPDGGCLLGGNARSNVSGTKTQPSQGSNDYWIVKLNAAGTKQWDRRFGGSDVELLQVLRPTFDGGYLLGGTSFSDISGDKTERNRGSAGDFWVVKIDSVGNKLWDITWGSGDDERLHAIIETQEGSYLLGGETRATNGSNQDYVLNKITDQGVYEWFRNLGGSGDDVLKAMHRTRNGDFILAGYSNSPVGPSKTQPSRGGSDYWLVRTDAFGNKLWDQTYGGAGEDQLTSLLPTPDGGFLLGGTSNSGVSGERTQPGRGGNDYWVVKVDSLGAKQWDRRFGGSANERLAALLPYGPNSYLLGGTSLSGATGDKTQPSWGREDYWLVAIDLQGNLQWNQRYGANDIDELTALALTSDGNVLVGGYSTSSRGGDKSDFNFGIANYWTLKLRPATPLATIDPTWTSAVSVFPNPAHQVLTIILPTPAASALPADQVVLVDMLGRPVLRRLLTTAALQQEAVQLSVAHLPPGVYTMQVKSSDLSLVTKRVIIN